MLSTARHRHRPFAPAATGTIALDGLKSSDSLATNGGRKLRRGSVLVLSACMLVIVFAFAAFTVDVGYITLTKAQLQNSADAAALAAALELLEQKQAAEFRPDAVAGEAGRFAALNNVAGTGPAVLGFLQDDENVTLGRMNEGRVFEATSDVTRMNAVRVFVRRTASQNGGIPLFFAPLVGIDRAEIHAEAIAGFRDRIRGFCPRECTGPSTLIPFSISLPDWESLERGQGPDQWRYDVKSRCVVPGSDGLPELHLFPRGVRPGNFGTLQIGRTNQGLPRLVEQIVNGVTESDLRSHGGELALGDVNGSLILPGDTGLSTPVFRAAEQILGKPVSIPVYSEVWGNGANAEYRIVRFIGARIVSVQATGNSKHITIQPAVVLDRTAIAGDGDTSRGIVKPAKLVR